MHLKALHGGLQQWLLHPTRAQDDMLSSTSLGMAQLIQDVAPNPRRHLMASDGLSTGVVIAIAAAGAALVVAAAIALFLYLRHNSKSKGKELPAEMLVEWKDLEKENTPLGVGGYGEVYKGQWKGNRVAIKTIRPDKVDASVIASLKEEARLMHQLQHPSIARVFGVVIQPPHYAIVMQYYRRGTVEEFMTGARPGSPIQYQDLDAVKRIQMGMMVARGMRFLHSRQPNPIVHGDLKTANLLMSSDDRVYIADFGLARPLVQNQQGKPNHPQSSVFSAHNTPPEVISSPTAPRSPPVDVFAFAITLLEIMSGQTVWHDVPPKLILKHVLQGKRPPIPPTVHKSVARIITLCWAQDAAARPNFVDIVAMLDESHKLIRQELPQYANVPIDTKYM